jgi:hypothetical protein
MVGPTSGVVFLRLLFTEGGAVETGRGFLKQQHAFTHLGLVCTSRGTAADSRPPVSSPGVSRRCLCDGSTLARAQARGLDAARALARFDAFPLFDSLSDAIMTGPTGNNVRDLRLLLAY